MADSFTQIYIQIVFAVKGRDYLIHSSWEEELYKYITGIVQNKKQKMLAINGMPDHIHFLIGWKPAYPLPDLVREVKKSSLTFINEKKFSKRPFSWQKGYGAFSYGQSQLNVIIKYIQNQKKHHQSKSFQKEFMEFLDKFEIDYHSKKLLDFID